MSEQYRLWRDGSVYPEYGAGRQSIRASIGREMRYLLTISYDASRPGRIRPAGIAHSLGVCLIEDWNMARGKGQSKGASAGSAMPAFVDIKLSREDRAAFLEWYSPDADQVGLLQQFTDDGYRVGVSWSGEHQSYTVSVTCRDADSPNNGLCVTSFARLLPQAIALAWFKHDVY